MPKTKIDSRAKGRRGEYKIRDYFSKWLGVPFKRSPGSGAWATVNKVHSMQGDIVCEDPSFRFSIEVKHVEGWTLEHLLCAKKCLLFKWWQQATDQAKAGKLPLLCFSKNNSQVFCMAYSRDVPRVKDKLTYMHEGEMLAVFLLDELRDTSKEDMFESHTLGG